MYDKNVMKQFLRHIYESFEFDLLPTYFKQLHIEDTDKLVIHETSSKVSNLN